MAARRLLNIRTVINPTLRLPLRRPYATEKGTQPELPDLTEVEEPIFLKEPTPEEHSAFLRGADQQYLAETREVANRLIKHAPKILSVLRELPLTIQKDVNIDPYTLSGRLPWDILAAIETGEAFISQAELVVDHLTDLLYEPYPDESQFGAVATAAQVGRMTKTEMREALSDVKLDEEAEMRRLEEKVRELEELVGRFKAPGAATSDVEEESDDTLSEEIMQARQETTLERDTPGAGPMVGGRKVKKAAVHAASAKAPAVDTRGTRNVEDVPKSKKEPKVRKVPRTETKVKETTQAMAEKGSKSESRMEVKSHGKPERKAKAKEKEVVTIESEVDQEVESDPATMQRNALAATLRQVAARHYGQVTP